MRELFILAAYASLAAGHGQIVNFKGKFSCDVPIA
jgi:hypothetical protein